MSAVVQNSDDLFRVQGGSRVVPFLWTPADLGASLVGFVDFEDNDSLSVSGGVIDAVADTVSAASYTASTTARPSLITSPTTGRQVASFDGSANTLSLASVPTGWPTGANPVEIFVVGIQAALPEDTTQRIAVCWGGGAAANGTLVVRVVASSVNRARVQVGNGTTGITDTLTSATLSGGFVLDTISTGSAISIAQNGAVSAGAACTPAVGTTRSRIGAGQAAGAANFWHGEISAILVCDAVLSARNRSLVHKWALGRVT